MDEQRQQANRAGSREAEDVKGFFTLVPIPSAQLTTFGSTTRLSGANLLLSRTTLANAAGPANNPCPTPIGG